MTAWPKNSALSRLGTCGERDGWQHLSDGDWSRNLRAPTQAQITAIFEWQQASPGRLLPPWFEETIAA